MVIKNTQFEKKTNQARIYFILFYCGYYNFQYNQLFYDFFSLIFRKYHCYSALKKNLHFNLKKCLQKLHLFPDNRHYYNVEIILN